MKIRSGFVSNSSSSSFVVISAPKYVKLESNDPQRGANYYVGRSGVTEFGWGPEIIVDIHSRINFAALQAIYAAEEKYREFRTRANPTEEWLEDWHTGWELRVSAHPWWKMLKRVIQNNSDCRYIKCSISPVIPDETKVWGYIDHQSSVEDGKNTEIFYDEDMLKDFIFGSQSQIKLDNDNH